MPALNVKDLSSLEKFVNAMEAVLAHINNHKEKPISTVTKSGLLSSSSSVNISVTHEDITTERTVWAEVAAVFWRIVSRQQTHLLFYVTIDAVYTWRQLSNGLLNYIHMRCANLLHNNVSVYEVMNCISSLSKDYILFFLETICALNNCILIMGEDRNSGKEFHNYVCNILIQQRHLHWMTYVFRIFCEYARQIWEEHKTISDISITAVRTILQCLLNCCINNENCAYELIYTEPKPLVSSLLFSMRLRIATLSLIRPMVEDNLTMEVNSALSSSLTECVYMNKRDLKKYITYGRMNIFDEITREALSVVVAAVEKIEAHNSPDIIVGLCLIMDLSSRSIIQSLKEETNISISVHIAMYENVLMTWNTICQLLRSTNKVISTSNLAVRREVILQQLLKHDLASSMQRILCYCPVLVTCESTLFERIKSFCIPPIIQNNKLTTIKNSLDRFIDSTTITNESFSGGVHMHSGKLGTFFKSIYEKQFPLHESTLYNTQRLAKSFWAGLWHSDSHDDHSSSHVRSLSSSARLTLHDDGPVNVSEQREMNEFANDQNASSSIASPEDEGEEWWYGNRAYVELVRSQTQVLNNLFLDPTTLPLLRLSLCKLLAQITMRTNCAFLTLEGRVVLRSFLKVLQELGKHALLSSVVSSGTLQPEEENCVKGFVISKSEIFGKFGSCEYMDKNSLNVLIAQQIVLALCHTYYVLHISPLSSEVVDLVELPFLLLQWGEKLKEEDINGTNNELRKILDSLFVPLLWMWYTGLVKNDNEDENNRSYELLMEVFTTLLKLGEMPVEVTEILSDLSNLVPNSPLTNSCIYSSVTLETTAESGKDHEVSQKREMSKLMFGDTVEVLRNIFFFLLEHDVRFLSTQMLELLFALLWVNDTRLSELGRKCIVSSLNFGNIYVRYAEVINNADDSLLVRLLPLFLIDFISSDMSTDANYERRVWLFEYGCVNAVIGVLKRLLLTPHCSVCFSQLIQVLFRFLSVFEPTQGRRPHLADTQLVNIFTESLASAEGVEYFICIAQAVLDAATSNYDNYHYHSRHVNTYGHFTLSTPIRSVEKPVFMDLISPLLNYAQQHAVDLEGDLRSAVYILLKTTTKVHSDTLLQWVLQRKQTEFLPFLDVDITTADHMLPYVGSNQELRLFWTPILREAPERAELRFNSTGGIVVRVGRWPEKGFSISAYFRFEDIYSNISLFEFINGEKNALSLASILIADGNTVHISHGGRKFPVNESHALPDFKPRRWFHFLIVMNVANTINVYINARNVGTCTLPYFKPCSEIIVHIGLVDHVVKEGLFSIGSVVIWDKALTTSQVEAYVAIKGYQPNVCKILECEVPREWSENRTPLPFEDRIAVFLPYENRDSLMINILQANSKRDPIVAKLTGNYAVPPKNWIDYRDVFLSRGGLNYLFDWISQSTTAQELKCYMELACDSIRWTTNSGTMDFRTYALMKFHLRSLAHLITPAVCDSLLHLATAQVNVNDELHPFIINRLVFDQILRDIELLAAMPIDCSVYLMKGVEKMFTVTSCPFAGRNARYIIPFCFVDSILNELIYSEVLLPFDILDSVISCLKHIMIACNFEPNVVHAFTSTAAVLTPAEMELIDQKLSSQRLRLPKARFTLIRAPPRCACDITLMILRSLIECCGNSVFSASLGEVVDLHWYVVCVSRFADSSSVVYATLLFFEALKFNINIRNEVMHNPAVIVTALSPHSINEDLLLLLLSLSVGAARYVDLLSSRYSLLQQLVAILDSITPEPDNIVAPIFAKVLTLHLSVLLSTPSCFRPYGISSVMRRRVHYSCRLYKYFSLARVCGRLMLHIYVKRLLPQSTNTFSKSIITDSTQSSPRSIRLDEVTRCYETTMSKYSAQRRRVWAAVRICVYIWRSIERRRYKIVLERANGNSSLTALNIEAKGTLFVLNALQSLLYRPNIFVSLTLSPYQIEAFAFLGTFLQREEVLERADKLFGLHENNATHIAVRNTSTNPPVVGSTRIRDTPTFLEGNADDWWEVVVEHDVDTEEEEEEDATINDRHDEGEEGQQREKTLVDITEESQQDTRTRTTVCFSEDGNAHRRTFRNQDFKRDEDDGYTKSPANLPSEHNEPRDVDVLSDKYWSLSHMLSTLPKCIAESGLVFEMKERLSARNLTVSTETMSYFNKTILRNKAVEVLGSIIVPSFFTLPASTGWICGQTYGSCGALLFQMMLVTGAVSSTEDAILTLTHFFIQQLFFRGHLFEDALKQKRNVTPLMGSNLKGTGDNNSYLSVLQHHSLSEVFVLNICGFNDLLVHFISFGVMNLSSFSSYFVAILTWASSSWPRRLQHRPRLQIVKCCIAVLNRPSVNEVTLQIMELVYMLLKRAMCPEWIMKDMLECLLRVIFRVYVSLPPANITEKEATKRKQLAVLTLRCMMRAYKGRKELHRALSAYSLTQRFSLYKDFEATLLIEDEVAAVAAFDAFCRDNMSTIDNFMSGRPTSKADMALKLLLKERNEYMKHINIFRETYSKTIELVEKYRPAEMTQAYNARFSSRIGHISSLSQKHVRWFVTPTYSFYQTDPNARLVRYVDLRGNYRTVVSGRCSEDVFSCVVGTDQCEQRLNHVSVLVRPFGIRCRPYVSDTHNSFVDPRCHVSCSAVALLRYLLAPNEVLRFISNGFRVKGIHVTPCLILLTTNAIKLFSFSRITETGDIVLCESEREDGELLSQSFNTSTQDTSRGKQSQQQIALSFALSVTNKLQRFLIEGGVGGGKRRRRRREMEARQDGTKVAQSVRQASAHSYRDIFWVYPVRNVHSVHMMHYLHQDTAILLNFIYDDSLLLSLVDAQQSMHTGARDTFLCMLKEILRLQGCEFYEYSQRTANIRSMLIRWAAGSVSTFDYIMFLNTVAGRTRADFNQYPVYPWVLADYRSNELALDSVATYRDLSRPMGAQTEARRQAVKRAYQQMVEICGSDANGESGTPFHHGTHYSTSGGVLYFLIRVEPFSTFARIFQGGEFDVASRLFDSIDGSFQSCINGPADCKELTPEFFLDGMFLLNENHHDFGEKPDGTIVNHVKLPPWAKGSTQVFTAVMRYVLESPAVVNNIHRWIDLIFGVRRRGRLAVESYNVFQRMTYGEEVLQALKESSNSHDIDVIVAEVDNFGQTPVQLFQERHPAQRELEPIDTMSNNNNNNNSEGVGTNSHNNNNNNNNNVSGSNGSGGSSCIRTGHTYTTAFQEQLPKVLSMIIHALDFPQIWYTLQEPTPGSFQSLPENLVEMFCVYEKSVVDFSTTRNGTKMCCYKFITPIDNTDYLLCWCESDHLLLRFDVVSGSFLSSLRITSITNSTANVSAFCVTCRETLILIGSNNGIIYCFGPSLEDDIILLGSTLCHHTNPIAGFTVNINYGRVISFTTNGSDCPIVWCVQRFYLEKMHQLDISRVLPFTTSGDRIVVAAVVDPRNANSIVITRRHLLIFDRHGEPFGVGALPISDVNISHVKDAVDKIGFVMDSGSKFVASMTAVTTYNTLEWSNGIQLLITGHQDGSLSLWRALRLPPDKVEHGRIVNVEYHGHIINGSHVVQLGAVTTIHQERPDAPVFLIGYNSGAVRVLSFDNRTVEITKLNKS